MDVAVVVVVIHLVVEILVVRDDEAALTHRDDLHRVEAVGPELADRPAVTALVPGPHGLARIFQQVKPVFVADRLEGVHVRGSPEHVDGHDGFRPVRDQGFHGGRIEAEAFVDFREHGNGAAFQDGLHGRDEGERTRDDLVTGTDAQGLESHVEAGRAAGNRKAVFRPELVRHGLLEFRDLPDAVAHPLEPVPVHDLPADHVRQGIDFLLVEQFVTRHYSIASL